ncbi:hypothetical protein THUN1379_24620 [Paludibacterium sp. THUN1379]|nr:hypothetical protein THUN1379_24620 [Paludibacterium sp. THUN1379]
MDMRSSHLSTFIDYFQQALPRLKERYVWTIPDDLPGFPDAGKQGYEPNVALKRFFHQAWLRADSARKLELAVDVVIKWGGVRANQPETLARYVQEADKAQPELSLKGIASFSKILSIVAPDRYAIYDARVAACLNALQINRGVTAGLAFHYVPGRNNVTGNVAKQCGFTLMSVFKREQLVSRGWQSMRSQDCYQTYLDTLQACLPHLPGYQLHDLEMLLFASAEIECRRAMDSLTSQSEVIALTYGGSFRLNDLIAQIKASGRDYIIQGQQVCALAAHTKPHSLDYWLRQYAKNKDTKQADNEVLEALMVTGRFDYEDELICPDTGRKCNGLRLRR